MARGMLDVLWFPAIEIPVDTVAWRLLDRIEQGRIKRVFIDGLDGFQAMFVYPERLLRFYTALVARLAALGATTVMAETALTMTPGPETVARTSLNNVLALNEVSNGKRTRRYIQALKVQAGPHDTAPRRIRVSRKGLSVARPFMGRLRGDKP
jgi:hypothetical protein